MIEIFRDRHPYSYSQARRHPRFPAQLSCRVKTDEFRVHDEVLNLSEGGLGLKTKHPFPAMALVCLELELPTEREPVEVVGRVMWSTRDSMGVRFERPDTRLISYVERVARDLDRI